MRGYGCSVIASQSSAIPLLQLLLVPFTTMISYPYVQRFGEIEFFTKLPSITTNVSCVTIYLATAV